MSVYEPLQFMEQFNSYYKLVGNKSSENLVNSIAIRCMKEYVSTRRNKVIEDFCSLREGTLSEDNVDKYLKDITDFYNKLGLVRNDDLNDFMDLAVCNIVRNDWRMNKLSYLVDNNLLDMLLEMKLPKSAPKDCLTKLPSNCFYIDYGGSGDKIFKGLVGTFVVSSLTDDLRFVLVSLIRNSRSSRLMYITTLFCVKDINDTVDRVKCSVSNLKDTDLVLEDGSSIVVSESRLLKFVYNFLIYLHASNKDIKISERTRKNHDRVITKVKDKFREVKEFEVGFVFGRSICKDATRIKYVGDKKNSPSKKVRRASHYRSAHWHHYWVGSGDDKKLIIKWVEGVFVDCGRDEAENIKIQRVK